MPVHTYIVPIVRFQRDPARPMITVSGKYADDPQVNSCAFLQFSGDAGDICLIAMDAPIAYLDQVAAEADAIRLSQGDDLDDVITSGQATMFKSMLENLLLPAGVVNAGDTRRQVIRRLWTLARFSVRMQSRYGTGWQKRANDRGITLATKWLQFPQGLKTEFQDVLTDMNLTPAQLGLTNQSTLREIMEALANFELHSRPYQFGGATY